MQSNGSITAEIERLEQNITLTLQEIDHNFSRCHRIITTHILPIVERYAEQSRAVWDGSKFWKQFFEASANVSLSGYEDLDPNNPETDTTAHTTMYTDVSQSHIAQTPRNTADERSFFSGVGDTSTPNPPPVLQTPARVYEPSYDSDSTPLQPGARDYGDATPGSSPMTNTNGAPSTARGNKGPLLHRVLDSNWRVQATPHRNNPVYASPSDASSATPKLDLDSRVWSSPAQRTPKTKTPMGKYGGFDDSDDEDGFPPGMSPPVTMQFSLPASKLLKTPAKEAANRLVKEALWTAGRGGHNVPESVESGQGSSWGRLDVDDGGSPIMYRGREGHGDESMMGGVQRLKLEENQDVGQDSGEWEL
ncbi:DASH complex subunit ask1 [Saitoella coloradoensis]